MSISAGKYGLWGLLVVGARVVGGGNSAVKFPFAGTETNEKKMSFFKEVFYPIMRQRAWVRSIALYEITRTLVNSA